jgi:hypothetical protein
MAIKGRLFPSQNCHSCYYDRAMLRRPLPWGIRGLVKLNFKPLETNQNLKEDISLTSTSASILFIRP